MNHYHRGKYSSKQTLKRKFFHFISESVNRLGFFMFGVISDSLKEKKLKTEYIF